MKRLFFCACALLLVGFICAQDIIVMTDGQQMTVNIVEVSKTQIKYRELSNPDGPLFVLETEEISTITFSNGQVKKYTHSSYDQPENTPSTSEPTIATASTTVEKKPVGRIYRDNGHYMRNETFIDSKEVENILRRENSVAYSSWQKGDRLIIAGGVFTGIGGGLVLSGLIPLFTGNRTACIAMECIGAVNTCIGLGLVCGGAAQYNKAIDIFNSRYDQAAVQLRWSVAPNGVGLALAF